MGWELIRQKNQTQIIKYYIRKNRNQVDHNYKVVNKVMLTNHDALKNMKLHKRFHLR